LTISALLAGCGGRSDSTTAIAATIKQQLQGKLTQRWAQDGLQGTAAVRSVICARQGDTQATCDAHVDATVDGRREDRDLPVSVTIDRANGNIVWSTPDLASVF
jgi:hypothetical protein